MHHLPIEQQLLLSAEIVALFGLCVRMWLNGLHRLYPSFFVFLLLELAQALIPVIVPVVSPLYRNLYVISQALILCYYALIVLELYSVVLRNLPGLASTARRYIRLTIAASTFLSLLPLAFEKTPNTVTGYLFLVERPVLSALLLLVLLITAFLVYYPVPLGRNVIAYLAGFGVYFLTKCVMTFMNNLGYFRNRQNSNIDMGVALMCLVFWCLALDRQGEKKLVVVGHQWNPGDEQRLMAQLKAMNASLLRSSRK